jgi:hypothetical protein
VSLWQYKDVLIDLISILNLFPNNIHIYICSTYHYTTIPMDVNINYIALWSSSSFLLETCRGMFEEKNMINAKPIVLQILQILLKTFDTMLWMFEYANKNATEEAWKFWLVNWWNIWLITTKNPKTNKTMQSIAKKMIKSYTFCISWLHKIFSSSI